MIKPQIPENEAKRIEALRQLQILDTPNEPVYDRLVELAASLCGTQIALITFIDVNRQWFKASVGTTYCETERDLSICGHAILQNDIFIVPDTLDDIRFHDNPFLLETGLRFYAGVPLIDADGNALGTLCVLDSEPKKLSEEQLNTLSILAEHVSLLLAKRQAIHVITQYQKELEGYQRELEEEHEVVSDLMARMIRTDRLTDPALEYWNRAADIMGGDLIAATRSSYGKYYVLIADSTGHGLPAAINLIPISETFYAMATKSLPVDLIVDSMNHKIKELSPANRFVAAIVLCVDADNKTIEIWNGGMPDAFLIDGTGKIERRFKSSNLALGIASLDQKPKTVIYQWQDAQQFIAYSDGLHEMLGANGRSCNYEKVEKIISETQANNRFGVLQSTVQEHANRQVPHDDISLVVISLRNLQSTKL